jgi:auxin efflux carrier family protein
MAPSAQAGLIPSFIAAIQASLSVLLVISYGAIAAHMKLLDPSSSKSISKICVRMFLPALLLTQIGSELHSGSAHRYGIVLLWAIICHLVSFLIGIAAHFFLGMPDWITAAIMFNNTTSYPLLLVQSLDQTGILGDLVTGDESTRQAIERAKSYFLVFATVSSCLTFAVGPRLIDSEHAPDPPSDKEELEEEDEDGNGIGRDEENGDADDELSPADEHTGLLFERARHASVASMSFFPSRRQSIAPVIAYDRRPSVIARKKWVRLGDRTKWWLLFLFDFLNAPLLGAVLGAVIGLVPALHVAFFSDTEDGGIFTAWLTESFKNIGSLFVPLPVVVAGVSLYVSTRKIKGEGSRSGTPWLTTLFVLVVRFAIWPVISIGVIYLLAKKTNSLGDDPMLWFTLMLMPTGPPAMKLITMVEVSNADEEDEDKIAKLLTVSFSSPSCIFEAHNLDIVHHLAGARIYCCGQFARQCSSQWNLNCGPILEYRIDIRWTNLLSE